MQPRLEKGWLVVPCDAHDRAQVFIDPGDGEWHPGFREPGVAKCRPVQQGRVTVRLKVDGIETSFHPVAI